LSKDVAPGIMKNFAEEQDYQHVPREDLYKYADLFEFSPEKDVSMATKKKKEESKVTKKMEDVILQLRFKIDKKRLPDLMKNTDKLASAVYLYCLRLFVSAYRKSL
jgi:hypothetical protein